MEDTTVQITQCQQKIKANTNQINSLKKDIEELEILKTKIDKLIKKVNQTADGTRTRVLRIPNMMRNVIKLNLFAGMLECANGAQYNNAISDLHTSRQNVQKQIDECNRKIRSLKNDIQNCNNQIQTMQTNMEGMQ